MSKNPVALSEYYKLYELALSYEGKSPKTLIVYFSDLNRFLRFMKAKLEREPALADLNEQAVMDYVASLKQGGKWQNHPFSPPSDKPVSALTIDQHVRTLKGFATWLHEKRYTRTNVLKALARPKRPTLIIEPLTEDEIKKVMATVKTRTPYDARNYAIIVTFLDTGLRCSELCGLTLQNVHLEGRSCYVKVMGKGQKERIVYLGRRAHEALLTYRTFVRPHYVKDPSEQHFFLSITGRELTVSAIDIMIQKVAKAAGVPRLHPHLLRHTAATQYLVHGGDVISLQRKLGHAGLEMTSRYVHLAAEQAATIEQRVAPMDKIDIKPMRVPKGR